MNEPVEHRSRIGAHDIWYEPDTGFVGFVHKGVMNLVEANQLVAYLVGRSRGEPIFFLADDRSATGYTPEARKALATSELIPVGVYIAVFGAPRVVRVVV
ncbi:MAG TPA: hypothetical protein VM580_14400, partial [Labilithrix sp.]|nr:hypothetical protein [Labilithrix sp.]